MHRDSDYTHEAELARQLVVEAGELCRRIQGELAGASIEKEDRTPVTVADFASQALVASRLLDEDSDTPVVAEEGSGWLRQEENREVLHSIVGFLTPHRPESTPDGVLDWIDHGASQPAERFWTLDPIDGTAGFLRDEQWVVALALVEKGEVRVAALAAPALAPSLTPEAASAGSCAVAVRGEGAWIGSMQDWSPTRMATSQEAEASRARILGSVVDRHTNPEAMARLRLQLGTQEGLIKVDSQAKFAILAGGKAELMFRLLSPARLGYREKIWDQAAGSLIVEEAGGRVSDIDGRRLDFSTGRQLTANRGVMASNGPLHEPGLVALRDLAIGKNG